MNAIEINNLTKRYPGFTLDHISFSLPSGSILGLVGENGAGKSTTISLIMNAISRDEGTVRVLGTDNQSEDFRSVKEQIGVVLDEAYFPEVITPKNVSAMMKHTYKNWDEPRYLNYLGAFRLPRQRRSRTFPGG